MPVTDIGRRKAAKTGIVLMNETQRYAQNAQRQKEES